MGQRFTDEKHLMGPRHELSTGTFTDAEGNDVLWYARQSQPCG